MVKTYEVQVPSILHIPGEAFTNGLVVVMAPNLDKPGTDHLRSAIADQVGQDAAGRLLVTNFDMNVVVFDEEQMRELGWVRAKE